MFSKNEQPLCSSHFNFSYYLLVLYEAFFGYTIEKRDMLTVEGNQVQTYQAIKKTTSSTGIQPKCCPGELLTLYLIPQIGPELDSFDMVHQINGEAIARLRSMKQTSSVQSKISFILNLNLIVENYVATEKPLEKAKELFRDYMMTTNDQPFIIRLDFQFLIYPNHKSEENFENFEKQIR